MSILSHFLRFVIILLIVLLIISLPLAVIAGAQEIMPLSGIKKGDKGYGLTVFEGTKPQRFDFEVLGVSNNGMNGYILVELSGGPKDKDGVEILKKTKILNGMSGSPMYATDGRIIGGLAFAYDFSLEAKAHITPIEIMVGFRPRLLEELESRAPVRAPFLNMRRFNQSFSDSKIVAGDMFVSCGYWGEDNDSCYSGTVTLVDSSNPNIIYTLGHDNGPTDFWAVPFWRAEVLTSMARLDSSNKIFLKTGPILGSVIFNGPFGQIAKIGQMPRLIPMQVVLENYFVTTKSSNYFFAYTSSVGSNIASVILAQKKNIASPLDLDAEIRIDISGLPQIYSRGRLASTVTTGLLIKEFTDSGSMQLIKHINVVLRSRPKYKILELLDAAPTAYKNKNGNLAASLLVTAGEGAKEWEKSIDFEVDKKYEGKSLVLSNGEAVAQAILTDLGNDPSVVDLLNSVSDRNALYVYFTDKTKASSNEEAMAKKLTAEEDLGGWKIKNGPKKYFNILAKIELSNPSFFINGQKDFALTLPATVPSVPSNSKKRKRFLFF